MAGHIRYNPEFEVLDSLFAAASCLYGPGAEVREGDERLRGEPKPAAWQSHEQQTVLTSDWLGRAAVVRDVSSLLLDKEDVWGEAATSSMVPPNCQPLVKVLIDCCRNVSADAGDGCALCLLVTDQLVRQGEILALERGIETAVIVDSFMYASRLCEDLLASISLPLSRLITSGGIWHVLEEVKELQEGRLAVSAAALEQVAMTVMATSVPLSRDVLTVVAGRVVGATLLILGCTASGADNDMYLMPEAPHQESLASVQSRLSLAYLPGSLREASMVRGGCVFSAQSCVSQSPYVRGFSQVGKLRVCLLDGPLRDRPVSSDRVVQRAVRHMASSGRGDTVQILKMARLEKEIRTLKDAGVSLVLSAGRVLPTALSLCASSGIHVLEDISVQELEKVAASLKCPVWDDLDDSSQSESDDEEWEARSIAASCDTLQCLESSAVVGGTSLVMAVGGGKKQMVSVVLPAACRSQYEDCALAVRKAVAGVTHVVYGSHVIPGAGGSELWLASQIRYAGLEESDGMRQFCLLAFATALEETVNVLATNVGACCGAALQAQGEQEGAETVTGRWVGLAGGQQENSRAVLSDGVWDVAATKFAALGAASEAACTLLRLT